MLMGRARVPLTIYCLWATGFSLPYFPATLRDRYLGYVPLYSLALIILFFSCPFSSMQTRRKAQDEQSRLVIREDEVHVGHRVYLYRPSIHVQLYLRWSRCR